MRCALLAFCLWLSFSGCKKEGATLNCHSIPQTQSPFGWQRVYDSLCVSEPDFNPDNSDEFLYTIRPYGNAKNSRIYIYNLASQTSRLVYTGNVIYRPRFGANGWILLNLGDNNVYKIKSSGEGLTQLTLEGNCFHPHWNYDYSKVGYSTGVKTLGIIIDLNGNRIDTLKDHFGWNEVSTWLMKDLLITNACHFVNIYDLERDSFYAIFKFSEEPTGCGLGVAILKDNNSVIWSHSDGIYKTRIDNRSTAKLLSSCNSKVYAHTS